MSKKIVNPLYRPFQPWIKLSINCAGILVFIISLIEDSQFYGGGHSQDKVFKAPLMMKIGAFLSWLVFLASGALTLYTCFGTLDLLVGLDLSWFVSSWWIIAPLLVLLPFLISTFLHSFGSRFMKAK